MRRWFEGMRSVVVPEEATGPRERRTECVIVLFLGAHVTEKRYLGE